MSQTSTDTNSEIIELIDMQVLGASLSTLHSALNIATKNGAYDLTDAFNIKVTFNNVVKSCQIFEKMQRAIIKLQGTTQPENNILDTSFNNPPMKTTPQVKPETNNVVV